MLAHPCVCSWHFVPVSLWPIATLPVEIIFILWSTTTLNSPPTSERCHFWAMTLPNWVCIPFKRNEWHTNFIQEQLSMSFRAPALGFAGGRSYSQVENPCSRDSIIPVTYIMYKQQTTKYPSLPLISIQKHSSPFPLNWMKYLRTGVYLCFSVTDHHLEIAAFHRL